MRASSRGASVANESFSTPEERKLSPIEAPIPTPFSLTSSSVLLQGNGTAVVPLAVSRSSSPLSRTGSAYGLPASPRDVRNLSNSRPPSRRSDNHSTAEGSEYAPTSELREMWLHHQRSSSSVDSSTALIRIPSLRPGHSRGASSSTSTESIHGLLGAPIIASRDLQRQMDAGAPRWKTMSPPLPAMTVSSRSHLGLPGLPPPPRQAKAENFRVPFPIPSAAAKPPMPPVPPSPPMPLYTKQSFDTASVYSQSEGSMIEPRKRKTSDETILRAPTPRTITPKPSQSVLNVHSLRGRSPTPNIHEDYEIAQIDGRSELRPAISAVASIPEQRSRRNVHFRTPSDEIRASRREVDVPSSKEAREEGFGSSVSLPRTVSTESLRTFHSQDSEDTMHQEIRSRTASLEHNDGNLTPMAWASLRVLTGSASVSTQQPRVGGERGEAPILSPESHTWDDDVMDSNNGLTVGSIRGEKPMVLMPTSPESRGSSVYFRFDAVGSREVLEEGIGGFPIAASRTGSAGNNGPSSHYN
jgi:hypothetical protein